MEQARIGVWLGLAALVVMWVFPLFGFIIAGAAMVASYQGLNSRGRGKAKIGLILGGIAFVSTFVYGLVWAFHALAVLLH